MVYIAPTLIDGDPVLAALLQPALDEIARLSASVRVSLSAYKTATETLNTNAVLQDDDDLVLAMAANKRYSFQAVIFYNSAATPDFKFGFSYPALATARYILFGQAAGGSGLASFWRDETLGGSLEGTGAAAVALMVGTWATGNTAGNLRFRWAQNTSNGANTSVLDGSSMSLTEI